MTAGIRDWLASNVNPLYLLVGRYIPMNPQLASDARQHLALTVGDCHQDTTADRANDVDLVEYLVVKLVELPVVLQVDYVGVRVLDDHVRTLWVAFAPPRGPVVEGITLNFEVAGEQRSLP